MKQIKLLAILFLATISLTSCSDDDSPVILPKVEHKGEYTVEGETFKLIEGMSIETNISTSTKQSTFFLSTDRLNIKDNNPYLSKNGQNTLFFTIIHGTSLIADGAPHYVDFSQIKTLNGGNNGLYVPKTSDLYPNVEVKITKNEDNTYKIEFTNDFDMGRLAEEDKKIIKGEFNGELKLLQVSTDDI